MNAYGSTTTYIGLIVDVPTYYMNYVIVPRTLDIILYRKSEIIDFSAFSGARIQWVLLNTFIIYSSKRFRFA